MRNSYLTTVVIAAALLSSCQKSVDMPFNEAEDAIFSASEAANGFAYKAQVMYKGPENSYNINQPVWTPSEPGYFKAIPSGLALNPVNGEIDVQKSMSGMRYKVFFINNQGIAKDSTSVMVSGIDFTDGIYEIGNTGVNASLAPVYNADKNLSLPRGNHNDEQNFSAPANLNRLGNEQIAGVNQEHLVMDRKSGAIDIAASVRSGMFGTASPSNGAVKDVRIGYRLNDESRKAPNEIDVRFYYFASRADIPADLLKTLAERRAIDARVQAGISTTMRAVRNQPTKENPGQGTGNQNTISSTSTGTSTTVSDPLDLNQDYKRRPPLIIIVGQ